MDLFVRCSPAAVKLVQFPIDMLGDIPSKLGTVTAGRGSPEWTDVSSSCVEIEFA